MALIVLLGFWSAGCLVAPRALADLAARRHPLPEPVSFKARLAAALGDPHGAPTILAQKTAALLKEHGVSKPEELPVNLAGLRLQVGEEHGYEVFDRFYGELFAPMEAQNRFLARSAALFPVMGVQALSMGLAGTDLAQHRDFIRAAEEHRRAEIKIINDNIYSRPVKAGEVLLGDGALWASVPPFSYAPPDLTWVLQEHATALVILLGWLVAAALFAGRSASRLTPV